MTKDDDAVPTRDGGLLDIRLSATQRSVLEEILVTQLDRGGAENHSMEVAVRTRYGREGADVLGNLRARDLLDVGKLGLRLRFAAVLALDTPEARRVVELVNRTGRLLREWYEAAPNVRRTRDEVAARLEGISRLEAGIALLYLDALGSLGGYSGEDSYPDTFSLIVRALDFRSVEDEVANGRYAAFVPNREERSSPTTVISADEFRRLVVRVYADAAGSRKRDVRRDIREKILEEAGAGVRDYHITAVLTWMAARRWITIGSAGDVVVNMSYVQEMRAYSDPLPGEVHEFVAPVIPNARNNMRVVMLSSSPEDPELDRLAVDTEYNRLREKLEASESGRHVDLDYWPDVLVDQLPTRLLAAPADVLHFSGHSTDEGGLTLRGRNGVIHCMQPEGIAQMIGALADHVRCVVLVACYSDELARRLEQEIDVVVGMRSEIDDESAITFVATFYDALARGHSVARSFNVAAGLLRALGNHTGEPILRTRVGVDANSLVICRSSHGSPVRT